MAPAPGQTFQDVEVGSMFYDFIERLVAKGVMNGSPCSGASELCTPPENRPYFIGLSTIYPRSCIPRNGS
jgi:hypothetical protein